MNNIQNPKPTIKNPKLKTHKCLWGFIVLLFSISCNQTENMFVSEELPPIYPDYINITIPYNIAPLNFVFREAQRVEVTLEGQSGTMRRMGKDKIQFSQNQWKKFLKEEMGHAITVTIKAKIQGNWYVYPSFEWIVSEDRIDPYLTYRLVEPGLTVMNKLQLCERNIENFSERIFADYNLLDNACMNCHIVGNQDPNISFFYLRGDQGGTIVNRNGQLRKISVQTEDLISPPRYGHLHPSGRYGVFSTNDAIPEYHTLSEVKLEVYDTYSDLIVLDFDNNRVINSPLISGNERLETFPFFSSDGKRIYYCVAPTLSLPEEIEQLKYSLCSIEFDAEQGAFGNQVDTLVDMSGADSKSVSFPRQSPDGRFLLYCVSDYGTFPLWHPDTDLAMMDLQTMESINTDTVNSNNSDSYHSWSSNSRWFVFASKRDDGWYGKPYFAYVDKAGNIHKPFVLPQRDPYFYDYTLVSFNLPELMIDKLPFTISDVENIYWKGDLELFK